MRNLRKLTLIFLLSFYFLNSFSQGVGIGEWRNHLPHKNCISVAEANNKIYCATPYSLFYYDKNDNSVEQLNKINGLSDFGVSIIESDKNNNILLIAYTNANIDLIKDGNIINIPDIKRKTIIGKKTINNILFVDKLAYLSCGFGIVVLDVENEEILDTYFIGPQGNQIDVLDLTYNDTSYFAATENGIYTAAIDEANLANYAVWSKPENFPNQNTKFDEIEYFGGKLIANNYQSGYANDTLFVFDGLTWDYFESGFSADFRSLRSFNENILIVSNTIINIYNKDFILENTIHNPNSLFLSPNDAIIDNNNFVWIADTYNGLVKVFAENSAERILLEGPATANVFSLSSKGDALWVAPGSRTSDWGALYKRDGVFYFNDDEWTRYYYNNNPAFEQIHDIVTIAIDPTNSQRVFAGAYRNDSAIVEFLENEVVNIYTEENSSLQKWPAADQIAITGMDFDSENNLWVANSGAPNILSVRVANGTPDGKWNSFNLGSVASGIDIGELIVDDYNQKWIIKRKTVESPYYLFVFSENNTIENTSDDNIKGITSAPGHGNISGNKVYCVAKDQDGEIWIGTDEGVSVVYSPENVFTNNNFDAQRILVEQDGYVQYLLETEVVTSICVDGDNKKWIGTDNTGVFLLSADGTEEILHFTVENSPLLSNMISDIAINNDGEVFIGTANGIISYRGTATPGTQTFENVYAFPNPVREGFTGKIGIKGLVDRADIKITDINGTLIYETKAEGGQAIWDGRNFNGRKAQTGVYLVFSTNEDGKETMVTKILIIN